MFPDGTDPAIMEKSIKNFDNYGSKNAESLPELFVSLLNKLASIEKLWPKGLCASTYQGSWISKTWDNKVGCMSVEDFTDQSQNVARAVGKSEVEDIYKCIHLSIQHVSAFLDGEILGSKLKEYLFGDIDIMPEDKKVGKPNIPVEPVQGLPGNRPSEGGKGTGKRKRNGTGQVMTLDSHLTKRPRYTEVWGGPPPVIWAGPPTPGWGGTPTVGWGGRPTVGWGVPASRGWGGLHTASWGGNATVNWVGPTPTYRSQELQSTEEALRRSCHQPANVGTSFVPRPVQPYRYPPVMVPVSDVPGGSNRTGGVPQY